LAFAAAEESAAGRWRMAAGVLARARRASGKIHERVQCTAEEVLPRLGCADRALGAIHSAGLCTVAALLCFAIPATFSSSRKQSADEPLPEYFSYIATFEGATPSARIVLSIA
jgi:hypothetical protein